MLDVLTPAHVEWLRAGMIAPTAASDPEGAQLLDELTEAGLMKRHGSSLRTPTDAGWLMGRTISAMGQLRADRIRVMAHGDGMVEAALMLKERAQLHVAAMQLAKAQGRKGATKRHLCIADEMLDVAIDAIKMATESVNAEAEKGQTDGEEA